jgi:hypothetical protein
MSDLGKSFLHLINEYPFFLGDFIAQDQVTEDQNKIVNIFYQSFYPNLNKGFNPVAYGGKMNPLILAEYTRKLYYRIENDNKFLGNKSDLEKLVDKYADRLKKKIEQTCGVHFAVDKLPFSEVFCCTQPKIEIPLNRPEKMKLEEQGYTLSVTIQGIVPSTAALVIPSNGINRTPFFAPIPVESILHGFSPDQMRLIHENFNDIPYVDAFVRKLKDMAWQTSIEKFDTELQREGHPFTAFLNGDKQLINTIKEIEWPRGDSNGNGKYQVVGLIRPSQRHSILMLYIPKVVAFASLGIAMTILYHMAAASLENPRTIIKKKEPKALQIASKPSAKQPKEVLDENLQGGQPSNLGPKFEYWTEKELDDLAEQRGIVNTVEWTAEELEELAIKRGIVKLPEWTEEELDKLANQRGGQDPMPNWEHPKDLRPCPNCDYSLQPEWDECPICSLKVNASVTLEDNKQKKESQNEEVWQPPE